MRRLEKADWLEFGLGQLAEKGHGALKAQTLAATLGVTRGSFYWHFADLDAFKRDLVALWADRASEGLVNTGVSGQDARTQLATLMVRAFRSGPGLERAMRAWAAAEAEVAAVVAAVDWRRTRLAEEMLEALGVPRVDAGPRARMIYWSAIGRLMLARPGDRGLSDREVGGLVTLLATVPERRAAG